MRSKVSFFDLAVGGLATWRLSSMLVDEHGPFGIFTRLREWSGIEYDADGKMVVFNESNPLTCLWCISVWVAPLFILCKPFKPIAWVLAASALAIGFDRHVNEKN